MTTAGWSCAPLESMRVFRLKKIIIQIDPTAFVIVGDVGQVMGNGFNSLKNSD